MRIVQLISLLTKKVLACKTKNLLGTMPCEDKVNSAQRDRSSHREVDQSFGFWSYIQDGQVSRLEFEHRKAERSRARRGNGEHPARATQREMSSGEITGERRSCNYDHVMAERQAPAWKEPKTQRNVAGERTRKGRGFSGHALAGLSLKQNALPHQLEMKADPHGGSKCLLMQEKQCTCQYQRFVHHCQCMHCYHHHVCNSHQPADSPHWHCSQHTPLCCRPASERVAWHDGGDGTPAQHAQRLQEDHKQPTTVARAPPLASTVTRAANTPARAVGAAPKLPQEHSKKKREPSLIMRLDLGNGVQRDLLHFEGDEPLQSARTFCRLHGFGGKGDTLTAVVEALAAHIRSNLEPPA